MSVEPTNPVGAVIDLGSNAVRLLIARALPGGRAQVLAEDRELTFFLQAVSPEGELLRDKAQPTALAVESFSQKARAAGAEFVCLIATAAGRKLQEPQATLERLLAASNGLPKVLSPEEEARLGFLGATYGLPASAERLCVIDIGGVSTEVSFGSPGNPRTQRSLPLGSQSATARFVTEDPVSRLEYRAFLAELRASLPRFLSGIPRTRLEGLGAGGAFTTLAAMALELPSFDKEAVCRIQLSLHKVQVLRRKLQQLPVEERRNLPGLEPERAHMMWAGAVIAEELMKELRLTRVALPRYGLRMGAFLAYCLPELGFSPPTSG